MMLKEPNQKKNIIFAKARLTDNMFGHMIDRLEKESLLDDTVIIAYTDHYTYALSDKTLLNQLSVEAGSSILEKVPAFIWYKGCESIEINKVCQTIDWLPTIANMLGKNITFKVL